MYRFTKFLNFLSEIPEEPDSKLAIIIGACVAVVVFLVVVGVVVVILRRRNRY